MSTTERPIRSEARSRLIPLLLVIALTLLLLAACGGGGGGNGNGAPSLKLRVAAINETTEEIAISLDAAEPGEPQMLATCDGEVYEFDIPDEEWVLSLNGQTVIDSFDLETNLLDRNLTAEVQANEDGTVTLTRIQAGSQVSRPAQLGICT